VPRHIFFAEPEEARRVIVKDVALLLPTAEWYSFKVELQQTFRQHKILSRRRLCRTTDL
jgi:hypothetical protein